MTGSPTAGEFPKWDYQEYPKTLRRDDFWGQVRRTILGREISEDEVHCIVEQIRSMLELRSSDVLVDLGCGNGALSVRLFDGCAGYTGVDLSSYLIEIAREFFERSPTHVFVVGDLLSYVLETADPGQFTKAMSYATIQYLELDAVETLFTTVRERFTSVTRLLVGNVPDRDRAGLFFGDRSGEVDLDQPASQIGRWWSASELAQMAQRCGWACSVARMPENVFNAKYRFDAVFTVRD